MREIKPLTSLRGIFAIWVLLFHLGVWSPRPGFDHLPLVSRGYLAVDFFFVLSGFILAGAHGKVFQYGFRINDYIRFLIKRIGRLFPLHWAVLIICLLSLLISGRELYWLPYILAEIALIHRWDVGYASMSAINGPDWSISTEWAANLLFPIFALTTLGSSRLVAWFFGFIAVIILIWLAVRNNGSMDISEARSPFPILRCFAEFSIGMLLARFQISTTAFHSDAVIVGLFVASLGLLLVPRSDIIVVGVITLITAGLSGNHGLVSRILSVKFLHWIGEISYSIYLLQIPVIIFIRQITSVISRPEWEMIAYISGSLTGTIALAAVTYSQIEMRFRRTGNQLSDYLARSNSKSLRQPNVL